MCLLTDDYPGMRRLGLKQPPGAVAAWSEYVRPPLGYSGDYVWCFYSEYMCLYVTRRSAYPPCVEFTVDYGKSYQRDYDSGVHRATLAYPRIDAIPQQAPASPDVWPSLTGWFNAARQPSRRPAFRIAADGTVHVCADEPAIVAARRAALEMQISGRGTALPTEISHFLTIKGARLTWAILHRYKLIENRAYPLPKGWIGLHVGSGKLDPERDAELVRLCKDIPREADLPHGVILGAVRIDGSCSVAECEGTSLEPWALGKVCNIIGAVCALPEPVAHSGALWLWEPDAAALTAVRAGLRESPILENDPVHLPRPSALASTAGRENTQVSLLWNIFDSL